eukprot:CAMPEP_0197535024 /NCGR_PEP_ID=MMETSP1318-20131121/49207_1 /TAXON_ID=552666 /ORGANISM="Partenskyella glossopodia, Strain RCC365" /LENGTH=85 /DNA_ID=CAMNT_0043092495 /DNA_START=227 /DNA_END=484 /DNA_ORIENTATION=+
MRQGAEDSKVAWSAVSAETDMEVNCIIQQDVHTPCHDVRGRKMRQNRIGSVYRGDLRMEKRFYIFSVVGFRKISSRYWQNRIAHV